MSRNGPFGQARPPQRRNQAEQDPYAPQSGAPSGNYWPQQQGGYPDPNGYPQQPQGGGYHYPPTQEPDPQYGYQPQQGYGQAPAQQWGQQDPRNYDLGSYMPNGAPPNGGMPGGYAEPPHFQQHPHQQEPPHFAQQPQHDGYAETDEYDEALDEDEPRKGRRWIVIVAALVGAIGLGGGLAYTYKMLFTSGSRPQIVKGIDFPNKVKSALKEKEQDKKLATRIDEDTPGGTPQGAETQEPTETPGGPRQVRIIPIGPTGQQTTTGSVPAKPGGVVIPGLMIDTPGQRPYPPQQQQKTALPQQPIVEPTQPQRKPPVVIVQPSGTTAPTTQPQAPVKVAVPKTKEVKEASVGPTPVSSGYVAVLSSQRSRMDAMKAYASMDQKYRDMLSASTFDVQEADLGEKGIWYRAVVGPPRSFDGAKKICDDLKAAGYPSCWPARY